MAPDGSWLACADKDGAVHIWDMATGQERATWMSHHGGVTALAEPRRADGFSQEGAMTGQYGSGT